jgi:23S rRNA pseudouridine2605 synthase
VSGPRRGRRRAPTPGTVRLARALSKLALASRREAVALVLAGRVQVDGALVLDPGHPVVPEDIHIAIDGAEAAPPSARTIALHKPRGVVTTRRDPEGRRTVYDLIADAGPGLTPVGRLDLASSGLLICTTESPLAAWLTDPAHGVEREYVVTVRGRVTADRAEAVALGIEDDGEWLRPARVDVLKTSGRESRLRVVLTEGRNREIRRLMAAVGHEVVGLVRVRIGGLELGDLPSGRWRDIQEPILRGAFPKYPGRRSRRPRRLAWVPPRGPLRGDST